MFLFKGKYEYFTIFKYRVNLLVIDSLVIVDWFLN